MKYKVYVNQEFFRNETPESAYVLGFLLADGGIKERSAYVMNTDRRVIDYIKPLVGGSIYKGVPRNVNHKIQYTLTWHRKSMVRDLQERYGLTHNKSYTGVWPKVKPENEPHLIRGYLDGDGCINDKRKLDVQATSASKLLMEGFNDAVCRLIGKRSSVLVKYYALSERNHYMVKVNGPYAKQLLQKVYFCGWGLKTAQAQKVVDRNILTRSEAIWLARKRKEVLNVKKRLSCQS